MENKKWGACSYESWRWLRPYILVIVIQLASSGMAIIAKFALNRGLSPSVLVVYRYSLAAAIISPFAFYFEKNAISKFTWPVILKILALGFLDPTLDQNMYYLALKLTSASFVAAVCNLIPAVTFMLAWILGLEKVKLSQNKSIAKVSGTIVSIAGALVLTLCKGLEIRTPWSRGGHRMEKSVSAGNHVVEGSIFAILACLSWAGFIILQAIILRDYPWQLTLAAVMSIVGASQGAIVALVIERKNFKAWSIGWNVELLAVIYAAIVGTGSSYYLAGYVIKDKGPVFVTTFMPLSMIIVAVAGLFFLAEDLFLGRIMGAVVIVLGLFMVVWGMSKDKMQPQENAVTTELEANAVQD